MSVQKPSISTPVTNAASIATAFAWKARIPAPKASWSSQGGSGGGGVQKERAQRLRCTAQDLFLLIHAGPDEAGSLLRVQ